MSPVTPSKRKVQYYPNGYPSLGLVARTLPLTFRRDANVATLRARLERWEKRQGNTGFEAKHLEKLPVELAYELVQVYVALRERYPEVRPDYIDFMVPQGVNMLASAGSYQDYYPNLRRLATEYDLDEIPLDIEQIKDTTDGDVDGKFIRDARREVELARDASLGNVFATGVIEMGDMFAKPLKYQRLIRYWDGRNARAIAAGRPVRVPPIGVSEATFVFIHEFGHLVEAELMNGPYRDFERVYTDLTECVFGIKAKPHQWRYHLVNYPIYEFTTVHGRHMGSKERQKETKKRLRAQIAALLGSYAPTSREELFAEAFALSLVHRSPRTRQRLAPLQTALTRAGLKVSRLPNLDKIA